MKRPAKKQLLAIGVIGAALLAAASWGTLRFAPGTQRHAECRITNDESRSAAATHEVVHALCTDPHPARVQLCQVITPAMPCPVPGIDCSCGSCAACGGAGWQALGPAPFQLYGQGEYVARARLEHVPVYRLRVDDELDVVFRLTRDIDPHPYELQVGDEVRIESATDKDDASLNRTVIIQPDGTITMPLLGQVAAARKTVDQLRNELESRYKDEAEQQPNGEKNGKRKHFYRQPGITVTPVRVNTKLEDIRATVDSRQGFGGQSRRARVTPEGTVALPAIGSVPAQGLTLEELKAEIDARFDQIVDGLEVQPILVQRAPRYVYVLGEVRQPARYTLEGPTTVMQAIAMAGSWNIGANVQQVVIFRRAEDWRMLATMVDLREALLGRMPCPAGEIWVADNDLIIVPKSKILLCNNFVELVFTKGLYGVVPITGNVSYTNVSALR